MTEEFVGTLVIGGTADEEYMVSLLRFLELEYDVDLEHVEDGSRRYMITATDRTTKRVDDQLSYEAVRDMGQLIQEGGHA